jgi:hypothetical protein
MPLDAVGLVMLPTERSALDDHCARQDDDLDRTTRSFIAELTVLLAALVSAAAFRVLYPGPEPAQRLWDARWLIRQNRARQPT